MPKFKLYFYAIVSFFCMLFSISRIHRTGSIDLESTLMFMGSLVWFEKAVDIYKR